MIRLRLYIFAKNITEVMCSSQWIIREYMMLICLITGTVITDYLDEILSAGFLHYYGTIFFFFNFWEDTLRLCKFCFSLKFYPQSLERIGGSYLLWWSNVLLYICLTAAIFIIWNSFVR